MTGQGDNEASHSPDDLIWWKSSYSNNTACVEVARERGLVFVRDTKDRSGPVLRFSVEEWNAFLGGVRDGEFDFT